VIGQVIAERYRIDAEIGAGGMGTVYKGFDTSTQDIVAIKHLKSELATPDLLERFKREGESLRDLNHPNIVKMFASITENEQHFLVIEYLPGGDLRQLLQQGDTLQIETILKYAIDIADALTRAHHLNIIHRDLKPANVLIAADGTPRLADFGIAHFETKQRVTATNAIVGTIDYIAPEALAGETIDNRSDVWSCGIMLFEMLTGKRPFTGTTVTQTIMAIMTETVPDIEELRPDIPLALADLIYRMLEKDPLQRIPSVRYVGAELESILHGNKSTPVTPHRFVTPTPVAATPILHNLPMNLTNFVGRKHEIADVSRLLKEEKTRLVTIVAQGGTGKSRLALEVARQNLDTFTDGVYFVELAPLSEPESIIQAMIDATRCPFVPDEKRSRLQQLVEYLGDKHMLLVLDNYEHLMGGAHFVTDILNATGKIHILVTSRQRLRQSNERLIELKAMSYPDRLTPEDALEYDAFQLFMQSARRIQADFELTQANLENITRICQGVQGLPLGIVLAASWLHMLSTEEIVAEMKKDFDFLESDLDDLPERQRSMRQVFEYSWQLMTEKEQQVLMALSVFRGGFTRDAASEVCQAGLRDLMGLMNKSLIQRDTESGRYSIHELLRQYAAEHLQQSGRADAIQDAHKVFFAKWMKAREGEITYKRQLAALDDIETDFENVRVAWEHSVQQKDYESLDLILEALHFFTEMSVRHDEGYGMIQDAMDITPETHLLYLRLVTRYARLGRQGNIGDRDTNLQLLLSARESVEQKDPVEIGYSYFVEATMIQNQPDVSDKFEKALSYLPQDSTFYSHTLAWFGGNYDDIDYEKSITMLHEALRIHRERGDINELPWTLTQLIIALGNRLHFQEAAALVDEALHYSRLIRHPDAETFVLLASGHLVMWSGDVEKAYDIATETYKTAKRSNQPLHPIMFCELRVQCLLILEKPVDDVLSSLHVLIEKAKASTPYVSDIPTRTPMAILLSCINNDDMAARRAWQTSIYGIPAGSWIQIFSVESILHFRANDDEFAATLIGHLSNYDPGVLKRWRLYQETISQLQKRMDELAYQQAYQHGKSLSMDEMAEVLKEKTGHPDYQ